MNIGKVLPILRCQKGFTLIELLAALVILTIVIGALMDISLQGMLWWKQVDREVDVRDNLRICLDLISKELSYAENIALLNKNEIIFYDSDRNKYRYYIYYDNNLKCYVLRRYSYATYNVASVGMYFSQNGMKVDYFDHKFLIPESQYSTYEPSKVTRLKISLTGGRDDAKDITYVTAVSLRCR